jgi:hypothetical protein
MRKSAAPCIPCLLPQTYKDCGAKTAKTPELVEHVVYNDGRFRFVWSAISSSPYVKSTGPTRYDVTASGQIHLRYDDRGRPVYGGLMVSCSCPNMKKWQGKLEDGVICVCKHAAAALRSVHDEAAIDELNRRHLSKRRIDGDFDEDSDSQANDVSTREGMTLEEKACKLLTPNQTPVKRALLESGPLKTPTNATARCLRCEEDYDPRYRSECRVLHPDKATHARQGGPGTYWVECLNCRKTFDCVSAGPCKAPPNMGYFCFVGSHTTDKALL